jgi:hypothetical protein
MASSIVDVIDSGVEGKMAKVLSCTITNEVIVAALATGLDGRKGTLKKLQMVQNIMTGISSP